MRIHSYRLPFSFNPQRLRDQLARIQPGEWVSHYNQSDFDGNWSGVALRSGDGSVGNLVVRPGDYLDTPLLARCPYFAEILASFACPLTAVRLLRLHAGSIIKEHSDPALGFEDGEMRLHIPIQTSEDVHFFLDGRRVMLAEGETWYLDLSRRHRIENRGRMDRIHLVIDGLVNDWVREIFREASLSGMTLPPESATPFDRFRDLVIEDRALQRELLAARDRSEFVQVAMQLGRERGLVFDADLVESAVRRGRQAWNQRWGNA